MNKKALQKLMREVKRCKQQSVDLKLPMIQYYLEMTYVELKTIESEQGLSDQKRPRKKPLWE